jgi:AAA domain
VSPPDKAEGPAAHRAPETATTVAPGSYPNIGTPEEAEALGRLLELLPGSAIGELEPNGQRSLLEEADEVEDEPDVLVPLDFTKLLAEGIPEPDYLDPPYVVRGARHWVFGPTESAKSLFFQYLAAKLTRQGRTVVFVEGENPLTTDLDRMPRLRPDFDRLRYFHMPPLDLNDRGHFLRLAEASGGADLVVLDTLTALWSGDENLNKEIVDFDRDVLVPLVRLTGAAVVVIHHMGHPQAFISRGGASAGRGASAMGQKADVVMVFQTVGEHEFTIDHGKNRTPGGYKEPKAKFRVIDTEDDGLDIEQLGKAIDERVAQCMDEAIEVAASSDGSLGTKALKAALRDRGFGGGTITSALRELRGEDPPRLRQVDGEVVGADGRHRRGKPWRLA